METIAWKTEYELGIESLDLQHKNLVFLLNKFHDFISKGKIVPKEEIEDLLVALGNYAVFHFDNEESIMEENEYPGFEEHKNLHEVFKKTVNNYILRYEQNNLSAMEIADFLKDWLLEHIAKEDMAFVPLLKSKGVI